MKKSLAIILAVVLVCAVLVVTAVAGGSASPTQQGVTGGTTAAADEAAAGEEAESDVVVTNLLDTEGADAEAVEFLEAAKGALEENAADLTAVCPALAEIEGAADFAVLDVVYVDFGEETAAAIKANGFVKVEFETKFNPDDEVKVLFTADDADNWEMLPDENVEVLENGNTVVKVVEPGVFAFIVK